jgi:hypothetical protein
LQQISKKLRFGFGFATCSWPSRARDGRFRVCLENGQWPTVILNTAVMLFQHLKNLSYLLRHRFSSLKNQTARNILKRYESHKHLGEQNQQMNIRN